MSDNYHDVREIQGAADEHDLEMLKRDVNAAEATIAVLERQNNRQHAEIQELAGRVEQAEEVLQRQASLFLQLATQVERLAAHVVTY